jgi:hypothetical protein
MWRLAGAHSFSYDVSALNVCRPNSIIGTPTRGGCVTSIAASWPRIAAVDEASVLRNLLVTQGYHELSRRFARMLGPENVTWFSFASWSSKTVGGFLQNPGWPRALRTFLSKGNTEVFRELEPVFGKFVRMFGEDREPELEKLERFLADLQEGSSVPDEVESDPHTRELALVSRGGQALLREAIRQYYGAKFEPHPKRRAEQILLANAHIGVHEQTRLQTYIRGALHAPVRVFCAPKLGAASHYISGPRAQSMLRRFATEKFLTLKLPDSQVRLGRDLRATPGQPLFPRMLENIEHPELGSLYRRYARNSTLPPVQIAHGTAAQDWGSLDQRMRFILELFRSRQQNQRLLEPTFTSVQVEAMKQGRIPHGPLT